ncbi:MAG: hypothetical protein D4R88_08005 [Methanosarcinales archaeon]|nr:MAG: hypothetical protein D4R88_08005 [Methanosarcinales archaeon]
MGSSLHGLLPEPMLSKQLKNPDQIFSYKLKNKVINLLEGREETDIFPTYYRVNTAKKIQEIARLTGFNIYKIKMIVSHAQFAVIPPLAVIELLLIKLLMKKPFKVCRSNIIGILQKTKG